MTPSIRIALEDLGLERVAADYPRDTRYPMADQIETVLLSDIATAGGLIGAER